jgi:hypothetical protein
VNLSPLLALCIPVISLFGQNFGENAQQMAAGLAKMHRAWGPGLNSPNASLSVVEVKREGRTIQYRLYAFGLPRPGNYVVVEWPVTQAKPSENLRGVTLDASGMAICAGSPGACGTPSKPNDPIDFIITRIPGEPFRLGLISSTDPKTKAFLNMVPIPNESTDEQCRIDSVLLTPGGEAVAIEGSGFAPSAELSIETSSGNEHHTGKATAEADGTYFSVVLPYRAGVQNGTTQVKFKSPACTPVLSFSWGKDLAHR